MSIRVQIDGQIEDLDPRILEPQERERIAKDGMFFYPDGRPMSGKVLAQTRAYFARNVEMSEPGHLGKHVKDPEGRPPLIPGLWSFGSIPMLGGAPKIGKTTLIADLIASLTVPDRRFLDYFEPTPYEHLDLWVINAETPPSDHEDLLLAAGVPDGDYVGEETGDWFGQLLIDHLEEMGGPQKFDLTDPAIYAEWETRLSRCWKCDGSDFWTPDVVVADGVTAILLAAGKNIEYVGAWYAAFRRLMRSLGIHNAIAIGHSTQKGDHLMGGVEALAGPDGLWNYDNRHRFSVEPRARGPRVRPIAVAEGKDGRLRARREPSTQTSADAGDAETPSEIVPKDPPTIDAAILTFIAQREAEGHPPKTRDIISEVPGGADVLHAALKKMSDPETGDGRVLRENNPGQGGGYLYRTGQVEAVAEEGKASK